MFVSIDNKWKSSLPETLISILVLSEITIGLAFRLWGEIGVRIKELLFGETIGPPQLNEYPVDPVGVETIKPSDQYEFKNWPSNFVWMFINDVVFFLTILISFSPTQKISSRIFEFKTLTWTSIYT